MEKKLTKSKLFVLEYAIKNHFKQCVIEDIKFNNNPGWCEYLEKKIKAGCVVTEFLVEQIISISET